MTTEQSSTAVIDYSHLSTEELGRQYDNACKLFLSEKIILAWILKYTTKEYSDYSVDEIATKYIEGNPIVSDDHERPDVPPQITGQSNEVLNIENVDIDYDIRFEVRNPINNCKETIIINLDAQSNFYPGYHIVSRGIFYDASMLASQYGTVFTSKNYDKIKKVYSIWLCTNPPKTRENTITKYSIHEENIIGNVKENSLFYDLLTVVMICTGPKNKNVTNPLLTLMDTIFNSDLSNTELKDTLKKDYNITLTPDMNERMKTMCNLSYGHAQRHYDRGYDSGYDSGIDNSRKETALIMFEDSEPFGKISKYSKLTPTQLCDIGLKANYIAKDSDGQLTYLGEKLVLEASV